MALISRRAMLAMLGASVPAFGRLPGTLFSAPETATPPLFESIPASRSGITWTHTSGRSPDYYLPETTGAGCAFFDYDNDGWMDIYLVNSGAADFYTPDKPLRNALYRNNRNGSFTDVTEKAGVAGSGYGMGVAAGDYNRDGHVDLFVTGYDHSVLYRNNGDGTFTDVTEKAGIRVPGWASSAVWFDAFQTGRLDLFVCHFVQYSKADNRFCGDGFHKERHYCVPRYYKPSASWLFRNNGDGTFTDVSVSSGIAALPSKAWGVVATDVNNDGWTDLFVANDTTPNLLLLNQKNGTFKDVALESDVAYSAEGATRSGMGVDAADLDQDGWQDLFVTNVDREMYSLYRNLHNGEFDDIARSSGMGAGTRNMSGWGIRFFDYDNDGNIDLMIANGHPDDQIEFSNSVVTYKEPMLLFHNDGKELHNVSAEAGPIFAQRLAARSLALGDFNNDGAVDVLVTINNGAPLLLQNHAAAANHWLGLTLVGVTANPDGIGAHIRWTTGGVTRSMQKSAGGSYLASHDPRVVLGLGTHTTIDRLEIKWPAPSKRVDTFTNVPVDRYVRLVEGQTTLVDESLQRTSRSR